LGRVIEVAGIKPSPGVKTHIKIRVTDNFDGSPIEFPVAVMNGQRDGRVLWVLAGIHGDETAGVQAARKLANAVEPKQLAGTLVIMPTVNTTAFNARLRESPIDGKDLNRIFPGKEDGTFSERLAHLLFQLIKTNARDDDCFLDLHGGGRYSTAASLIEMPEIGGKLDDTQMDIAEATCNPWLWIIARIGKVGPWRDIYKGTIGTELQKYFSTPKITIEAGALSQGREEHIQAHLQGALNLLRHLKMLEGTPQKPTETIIRITENRRVAPTHRGFWVPKVSVRDKVTKGQLIAVVEDSLAKEIERLYSPYDGIVLYMRGNGLVDPLAGNHSLGYGANVGKYP